MEKKLPIYKLEIKEELDSNTGIFTISLVENPAIETNFVLFSKDNDKLNLLKLAVTDEDKRIVFGPVLIPDFPIYRLDKEKGEYYNSYTSIK